VSERKQVLFAPPDGHNKPSTAGDPAQPGGEVAERVLPTIDRNSRTHQPAQRAAALPLI